METASLLLICESYPPVLGGSEVEAQRVAAALRQRGHSVTVVCAGGRSMPRQRSWTDPYGTPVRTFGHMESNSWRARVFALGVLWTLFRERRRYDIAYFLMHGLHLAVGVPFAHRLGKPSIVKFSGSNLLPHLSQSAVGRWQVRVLQRFVRHIMILNPGMVEEAITAGLPRDHLLWMPNPVDVSAFVPKDAAERNALRASAGIGPDTMVALFLGRLAPEKQLSSLISAAAQLRTRFPDTLLAVAGDGPERAALEAQAKASDAPVRFLGRLNEDQVRGWMSISNGFTLVSSQEGFPVSLVEAMAMGLPSVVSDIPANAQLIDPGIHGLLVPVGDSTAIANALEHLWKDEALRHRMGTAARQRVVENYSTAQVIDRYEALFAEVLKTPPPAV